METKTLPMNRSKDAFCSLKIDQNPAYYDISYDIIQKCSTVYVNLRNICLVFHLKRVLFLMTEK